MCSFYSPERGHKGNNIQSSPSGYYSVSEFARDHYSVALPNTFCYIHLSFHLIQASHLNMFYT